MSLENARDSYVDLLMIKAEHQEQLRRDDKIFINSSNKQLRTHTSFRQVSDLYYEPCDVEKDEEEKCPIWEMTNDDPWRDGAHDVVSSIAQCERIFTVQEVYDEMKTGDAGKSVSISSMVLRNKGSNTKRRNCDQSIFDCFNPWKEMISTAPSSSNEDSRGEEKLSPKDIVRRSSMAVQLYLSQTATRRRFCIPSLFNVCVEGEGGETIQNQSCALIRRSCLRHADKAASINKSKKYKVHFSELKRVLRVRKFNPIESIEIWFQREDFDYFKNEMTLLIQEDGASRELAQVWLEAQGEGDDEEGDVLSSFSRPHRRDDSNASATSKWWHDYDHSRRGLERYASPGQAKQIVASYKVAVRKVMGEQSRQRLLGCMCIPNAYNADKIAEIYHEYTSWSRDLALAAAASDADAVRTNFDEDKRHTREYYLLKQCISCGNLVHKHMPQFMLPKCISPKGFLDESKTLYMRRAGSLSDGVEARAKMSLLNSPVAGHVAPALVPSLQANKEWFAAKSSYIGSGVHSKSLAEKAKNYPFQQND